MNQAGGGRAILVTGATGGFGLAIVAACVRAGHRVRATGRSPAMAPRLAALGAEFMPADLTRPRAADILCAGQDSVVHAAALSSSWGPAATFDAINVDATAALLAAAQRQQCGRFVFISSPSIYAAMRDRIDLTEDDPPADPPLNHYALTKLRGERLVLAANRAGFRTTALRPRAITGPDDAVLLPRLAELAMRRRMPLLRGGRALIEFTDARDAADAVVLAEERIDAVAGGALNISGGRPLAMRAIAERLTEALGRTARFAPVPMPAARLIAALAEGRASARADAPEPLLTHYTLATLAYSQTFDLARARSAIGYAPRHEGIAALLEAAEGMRR